MIPGEHEGRPRQTEPSAWWSDTSSTRDTSALQDHKQPGSSRGTWHSGLQSWGMVQIHSDLLQQTWDPTSRGLGEFHDESHAVERDDQTSCEQQRRWSQPDQWTWRSSTTRPGWELSWPEDCQSSQQVDKPSYTHLKQEYSRSRQQWFSITCHVEAPSFQEHPQAEDSLEEVVSKHQTLDLVRLLVLHVPEEDMNQ